MVGTGTGRATAWRSSQGGAGYRSGKRDQRTGAFGDQFPRKLSNSGASRADEGFWVAVLPFKHGGSNSELAALADGLTDDIVTNMSKFSYLRVVARGSTAQYAQRGRSMCVPPRENWARAM